MLISGRPDPRVGSSSERPGVSDFWRLPPKTPRRPVAYFPRFVPCAGDQLGCCVAPRGILLSCVLLRSILSGFLLFLPIVPTMVFCFGCSVGSSLPVQPTKPLTTPAASGPALRYGYLLALCLQMSPRRVFPQFYCIFSNFFMYPFFIF